MRNTRQILEAIYNDHGELTPDIILSEAADEHHPLHSRFTWDDTAAADQWRREEARHLIKSVHITYTQTNGKPAEIRAFVPVVSTSGKADFQPVAIALGNTDTAELVIAEFRRKLEALRSQYGHLRDYAAILRAEADSWAA